MVQKGMTTTTWMKNDVTTMMESGSIIRMENDKASSKPSAVRKQLTPMA